MADFVEIKHKRRKVILNLDQICAIEESDGSGDLLICCSNAEDYLVERAGIRKYPRCRQETQTS